MTEVMVIDDNAVNREQAVQLLKRLGADTMVVSDGPSAVSSLRSKNVDLILMDIRMPGMDGVETTKRIRAAEAQRGRTPIIAVTAYGGKDNFEPYREAGMNGFISKPLTMEKLQDIFDRWVNKKSSVVQQRIERKTKIRFDFWRDPT